MSGSPQHGRPRVAVVGGGIAGLAAAYELVGAEPERADVIVYEAAERVGGKIRTTTFAGLPIDEGADAFLARVPWATELCRRLGLGDELVSPTPGSAYVWSRGRLRALPEGLVLGVPTGVRALARSGVLPPAGVARAALEPLLPRRRFDDDLGQLIRSRFGDAVLTRLVDPLVGGIYAGDAGRLSLSASTPQLRDLATAHRSLIVGGLRQQREARRTAASGAQAPVFFTVASGLGTVVDRLAEALGPRVVTGHAVRSIGRRDHGFDVDGERFDAVVVATPAPVAAGQIEAVSATTAAALRAIELVGVALVTLAVRTGDVGRPLDGSGFLVPRPERRTITACSWGSTKWPHWRPDGQVVLRASVGSDGDQATLDADDPSLLESVLTDLERMMQLRGAPTDVRVTRWDRAFPQYRPGHFERIDALEADLAREAPGLVLAGAAYRGIGIPACINSGQRAARRVLEQFAPR